MQRVVQLTYQAIIDDVLARVKPEFIQEGIDEAVLEELRLSWESKLYETGVLNAEYPEEVLAGATKGTPDKRKGSSKAAAKVTPAVDVDALQREDGTNASHSEEVDEKAELDGSVEAERSNTPLILGTADNAPAVEAAVALLHDSEINPEPLVALDSVPSLGPTEPVIGFPAAAAAVAAQWLNSYPVQPLDQYLHPGFQQQQQQYAGALGLQQQQLVNALSMQQQQQQLVGALGLHQQDFAGALGLQQQQFGSSLGIPGTAGYGLEQGLSFSLSGLPSASLSGLLGDNFNYGHLSGLEGLQSLMPGASIGNDKKRKADGTDVVNGRPSKLQQPHGGLGRIPQQDGTNDDEEPREDDEVLSEISDDAEEDEDDDMEDVILATFERVSRTKNRWKTVLRDCVGHLDGRDYLWHKGQGEMEF